MYGQQAECGFLILVYTFSWGGHGALPFFRFTIYGIFFSTRWFGFIEVVFVAPTPSFISFRRWELIFSVAFFGWTRIAMPKSSLTARAILASAVKVGTRRNYEREFDFFRPFFGNLWGALWHQPLLGGN